MNGVSFPDDGFKVALRDVSFFTQTVTLETFHMYDVSLVKHSHYKFLEAVYTSQ